MCFSIHVDKNIKRLAQMYGATINEKAFSNLFKMQAAEPKKYKYDENEQRVYIKDWAPILTRVKDELEIRPMRYQLLPHFCEEEKYIRVEHKTGKKKEISATYNARLDSIETRKAWKKPFLNFHGLVIMDGFFEWVLKDEKKVQIKFTPINNQHILTPCLYDNWYSKDKEKIIQSFAIITTEPHTDVLKMGHDRSPINISENLIENWLSPKSREQYLEVLNSTKDENYNYSWLNL